MTHHRSCQASAALPLEHDELATGADEDEQRSIGARYDASDVARETGGNTPASEPPQMGLCRGRSARSHSALHWGGQLRSEQGSRT